MKREITPIVFACDENYILPVAVAIYSLLKNGLKNKWTPIMILTDGKISRDGLDLFDILKKEFPDCFLQVLKIEQDIFLSAKIQNEGLTNATLYRLLLPGILKQYKKCVYLDGDILVLQDIIALIDINMSGKCLAGVLDREVQKRKEHADEIGLPVLSEYINAGVLVMNLELLRKLGKEEEFLSQVSVGYFFADQDILNKSCFGYIKFLPREYNWFSKYPKRDASVSIFHYAGSSMERPWLNNRTREAELWWEYASLFKQSPIYQRLDQKAKATSCARNFRHILEYCRDYQSIYIWGYTSHGRKLLDGLTRNGISQIEGFIDNNLDKQTSVYQGYRVFSPQIIKYNEKCLIINAAQNNKDTVNAFLREKDFEDENVLQFLIKTPSYFQMLDDKYFVDEFRDYLLKEYGIER